MTSETLVASAQILCRHLSEDGSGFGGWIGGFGDGPSDHDMRCAGCDRLCWRYHARLVVVPTPRRSYARRHDHEFPPKLFAQRFAFVRRGHYAPAAIRQRQRRQTQYLIGDATAHAEYSKIRIVE